ncbi:hypothetical protein ACFPAF_20675 [Hymenobacter endophyticus]|uniref:Uncharacterized protein n=1 Tax=Hymenobacter endophyticus TaxID=3076335 RepID=A0ABU3TN67_9BACT|nr:hypothetical protein [Hymenobacter endophyticus]MDU0372827.1 hypothetical protein [Hymenobacter endophyticus]
MMGKPTNLRGPRGLLLGLLLGTLLLSTGLNLFLLCQEPAFLASYDLDGPLLESATELELLQTRQALVECQAGHLRTTASAPADTLASPLISLTP